MLSEIFPLLGMFLVLFLIGMFYINGVFRGDLANNRIGRILSLGLIFNVDKVLFGEITNRRAVLSADALAFLINCIGGFSLFIAFILAEFEVIGAQLAMYIGGVVFLPCLIISCITRYLFIIFFRRKTVNNTPAIWPLKKSRGA